MQHVRILLLWSVVCLIPRSSRSSTFPSLPSGSVSPSCSSSGVVCAASSEPEHYHRQQHQKQKQHKEESTSIDVEQESGPPNTYFTTTQQHLLHRTRVDLTDFDFTETTGNNTNDTVSALIDHLTGNLQNRLVSLFQKTKTPECRALIAEHFGYFINGIGTEQSVPFGDSHFTNTCPEPIYDFDNLPEGMQIGMIQNRSYQPEDAEYIDDPDQLQLLYAILTHNEPNSTIRLIEQLYVSNTTTTFVIHVDGKSDDTYHALLDYAATRRDYVHILPIRVRANWGGFTLVNCTLQILKYAFGLYPDLNPTPLPFHKFVHLASTSYPLVSNTRIRQTLADYPLDANLVHVILKPTRPHPHSWHYFVECDDRLHRIYRLRPLWTGSGGIELYTSSQWFVLSREFASYVAQAQKGTFVHDFLEYARHTVVADETFFGTVLRNTEFCTKHHNWNFLHLQFDRWESDVDVAERDERKCMMPDPNHCGRSPTTLTMDYLDLLELTGDLFARKFLDSVDAQIKDVIDEKRQREELELQGKIEPTKPFSTEFEGYGTLFVARSSIQSSYQNGTTTTAATATTTPMCLGLGETRNRLRLVPCFHDWVLPTLAPGWETGAVILEETPLHNRWQVGPCSTNGILHRLDNATMQALAANYSNANANATSNHSANNIGPRCMLTQMDGIREGRCADGESGMQPRPGGGIVQIYPCAKRWHQFWAFGNTSHTGGVGSIFMTIPGHVVRGVRKKQESEEVAEEERQEAHLCLGVRGRGDRDEQDWVDEPQPKQDDDEEFVGVYPEEGFEPGEDGRLPLQAWNGKQVITTRCTNTGGVIEWLVVPFIVEDDDDDEEEGADSEGKNDEENTTAEDEEENETDESEADSEHTEL